MTLPPTPRLAFIGFGEAGAAFADRADARGYDRKLGDPALRPAKLDDFARAGVTPCDHAGDALAGADAVLCVVTADQALDAARAAAPLLEPDAWWFDMNSVAPDTKRAAARAVEAAGGRYVDVAVMAPVLPARRDVPLLVAGPHADAAAAALTAIGFRDVTPVAGAIGAAAAIKMIRSVMVKGLEALSAECAIAAHAAGVLDAVVASLDASWPGAGWGRRFDYGLDRMMEHGTRRAAEMEEVAATLDALAVACPMTLATIERQRALGALCVAPPAGLAAKLDALRPVAVQCSREKAA